MPEFDAAIKHFGSRRALDECTFTAPGPAAAGRDDAGRKEHHDTLRPGHSGAGGRRDDRPRSGPRIAVAVITADVIIGVIAGASFTALTVQSVKLWIGADRRRRRP